MKHSTHIYLEAGLWRWMRFAGQHRKIVIGGWLILAIIGLCLAVTRLGINADTSQMISEHVSYRQDEIKFEKAFPDLNEQVLILVRADTADEADIFASQLAEKLRADKAHVKSLYAPAIDPFFQRNGLLYLSVSELETQLAQLTQAAPLIERLSLDPTLPSFFDALTQAAEQEDESANAVFNALSRTLGEHVNGASTPLSWRSIFVDDLTPPYQQLLSIDPVLDQARLRPAAGVQEAIERAAYQIREETHLTADIYVTGNPVLRSDELQSVSRGIGLAFLISFIMVGILLLWALRSPVLSFFTLLSLIISILITSGLASLIFTELNLVSVAFTVLMIGLGVDFAIHLLLHLRHERAQGKTVSLSTYKSARGIGTALVLTAPSTALAFFAFIPTKFVGISQLGIIAGIGVLIAFLVATSLLPAIFSYLPLPKRKPKHNPKAAKPRRIRDTQRHSLAIGVIILGLIGVFFLPQARFDADPMSLRNTASPSVTAFNALFDTANTTPYRLSLLADNIESAKALSPRLEALESVDNARNLSDFIPEDQADKLELIEYGAIGLEFALSGEGEAAPISPNVTQDLITALRAYGSPEATRLADTLISWQSAQKENPELYQRSEHAVFLYWPYELDRLRAQIKPQNVSLETLPHNMTSRYLAADGRVRIEITPKGDVRDTDLRKTFISDVKSIAPDVTGSARNVQEAGEIVQNAMLRAISIALFAVSLLLYAVVRDFKLVIIMLIPLLLAGILTTVTGVFLGLPYNFANVIVLPLLIGIGVDSSLHLALQARKAHTPGAVFDTVTPRAVLFSAFTTIASFGSLSFSQHRGTASMGALLTIAIIWVIICTVIVTPSLMDWVSRKRERT